MRGPANNIFGPEIAGNRGKIVTSMGDGWLVEIARVVDAINCSMKVQDSLTERENLKLRTGVHFGDVVQQRGDIFGDGVNMAARLESIAEPGGIAISQITYSSLDETLAPSFDDAGEKELKNTKRPVRVWIRGASAMDPVQKRSKTAARTGFLGLVFTSVTSQSSDAEMRELADALIFDFRAPFFDSVAGSGG